MVYLLLTCHHNYIPIETDEGAYAWLDTGFYVYVMQVQFCAPCARAIQRFIPERDYMTEQYDHLPIILVWVMSQYLIGQSFAKAQLD